MNPHRSNYFLYNRNSGMVDQIISGANLTWAGGDITTSVYSAFNEVYDFKGNVIGTTNAEVDSISLNADGTSATVTDFDGATYTFEVDQSDRAIYRYTDYLKAPGPGRWAALAETAPEATAQATEEPTEKPKVSAADLQAQGILTVGAKGEDVKKCQQRLKDLGYLNGKVDGQFGGGTKRAVIAFQRRNGLTTDGVAGEETRAKL